MTSFQVLMEIEAKSVQSSQQMSIVKAQIAAKSREARILQLTGSELSSLPSGTPVYEGVGKM
jgi:prefoldin subunit 1